MSKESIYSEFAPPRYLGLVGTIVGIIAYLSVLFVLSSPPLAFLAAVVVIIVTMLVGLTWPLRHNKLLWVLITVIAGAHVGALFLVTLPSKISYGVIFMPFAMVDVFIFWKAIVFILKSIDQKEQRK